MRVLLLVFSLVFIFVACSSTEQTTQNATEEIYIFDDTSVKESVKTDIPSATVKKTELSPEIQNKEFIVQLAAFSIEDKADSYINECQKLLKYKLVKYYNEKNKLFVVQIIPFKLRKEAEEVRNELWKNEKFKDAFIVP